MGKCEKNGEGSAGKPSPGAKGAKKAGLGAALIATVVAITGGFSKENGLEWVKSGVLAIGLALLIRWPVGEPFRIPSGSMEPTLHGDPKLLHGDRVWVNKFVYGIRWPLNDIRIPFTKINIRYAKERIFRCREPQRWDIVVFKSAEDGAKFNTLIKRVVGLPGERVHIADGRVHINGEPLELPEGMPDVYYTAPYSFGNYSNMKYGILEDDLHAVVPENHYLLLGDNSAQSRDGRVWGWMPNERIVGRAACIWWPPSRWRDFTGFSKTWWWRGILTVLGLLLVVRLFFGRSWRVVPMAAGEEAKPLHLFINRLAFGLPIPFTKYRLIPGRAPKRGELVLYHCPHNEQGHEGILLGRVAGLAGERVLIDGGRLHIEGAPVDDPPVLAQAVYQGDEATGPFGRSKGRPHSQVPGGHCFVLHDPEWSDGTLDSRTLGWVPSTALIGVASAVWWPVARRRRVR